MYKRQIQAFFAVIAINMVNSFNATGYFNNDGTLFTVDQIQILQNINAWGWNLLAGIAVICVLTVNNGELPTYGVYSGWGGSILILVFSLGSIFGLLPEGAFILIAVLGGVILFPAFIFSFSSAFSKAPEALMPLQLVLWITFILGLGVGPLLAWRNRE